MYVSGRIEQNPRVFCQNLFSVPIFTGHIIRQSHVLIILALDFNSGVALGFFRYLNGQSDPWPIPADVMQPSATLGRITYDMEPMTFSICSK